MKKQSGTKRSSKKTATTTIIDDLQKREEIAKQIALMISVQLGERFPFFTGSKEFKAILTDARGNQVEGGLRMNLQTNKTKANRLEILLTAEDLYDMHFYSTWMDNAKGERVVTTKELIRGINNLQLTQLFEDVTGLLVK